MAVSNPYPGLRPFEEGDAHLFFGRKEAVRELLTLLREHRFLAVLGLSGSGKSSLIRAGLLPAMHLGAMGEEFADWRVATFQPGMDPIGALAAALDDPKVLGPDPGGRAVLERSGRGLAERALRASLADGSYLLVFVDQFEEIFRFQQERAQGPNEAALFVRLLLAAAQEQWSRVHVLITMRSDFLGECAQFSGLPEALKDGQYLVRGLTPDQRQEAIEQPARLARTQVTSGLVQQVLNDTGDDPARLPVMQHALMRTYEHGRPGPLTLEHYETAGMMAHALDWHAQTIFNDLAKADQPIARRMFQSLAERRAGARDTRRPTTVAKIAAICGVPEERIATIYTHFSGESRTFLTCRNTQAPQQACRTGMSGDGVTPESLVDVTHESLLHSWKLLNRWIDEEEDLGRRFTTLAEEWLKHRDDLLEGSHLGRAKEWLADVQKDLPPDLSRAQRAEALEAWAKRYPVRQGELETRVGFADVKRLIEQSEARRDQVERQRQSRKRRELFTYQALALVFVVAVTLGFAYRRSVAQTRELDVQKRQLQSSANRLAAERLEKEAAARLAQRGEETAKRSQQDAEQARKEAQSQRDLARVAEQDALQANKRATAALGETQGALLATKKARDDEAEAANDAKNNLVLAQKAVEEERKQRRIAVSRALLAKSESLRAQKASLWPSSIAIGLAAIQYVDSDPEFVKQVANDWSRAFAILPRQIRRMPVPPEERLVTFAFARQGDLLAVSSVVLLKTRVRLFDQQGTLITTLTPDTSIARLVFSPDGHYLAALGQTQALIWDVKTPTQIGTLKSAAHTDDVNALVFARDARTFATGSDDGTACIWRSDTAEKVRCFQHPKGEYVTTLDLSRDGQKLITGTDEDYVRVWEIGTGRKAAEMKHDGSVNAVRFSPDGRLVASASADRTVRLWDPVSREIRATLNLSNPVTQVEFGGKDRLVTAGSDNTVRLWTTTGRSVANLTHENRILGVTFSPDGRYVGTASADNTARVWDVTRGAEIWRAVHDGSVVGIGFSADGRHFATASLDKTARVWEIPGGPEVARIIEGGADKAAFADPDRLAVLGSDHDLRLFDLTLRTAAEPRTGPFHAMAFSQDGRHVAMAMSKRGSEEVQLVDLTSPPGKPIAIPIGAVTTMAFDPRGLVLAIGSLNAVTLWDVATGKDLGLKLRHDDLVNAAAFSPDGQYVATGSDDRTARVWEASTGKPIATLRHARLEFVIAVQFSPDGNKLATGTDENLARVWRWRDQQEEATFRHGDAVVALAFDSKGTRLATASNDNTARVWDLSSGGERRFDLASPSRAVRFTDEDQKLSTVTLNGTLGTWSLAPEDLLKEACTRLPRNLTRAEWKTYIGDDPPYRETCRPLPQASTSPQTDAEGQRR
jgi:WD40 repeat protein